MYSAEVLADSLSNTGKRLTTVLATFPRFILAEVNTHRVFSRNSASSRAIPPEDLIARVKEYPFVPETFNSRVKGMGVGDELDVADALRARDTWLAAQRQAVIHAEALNEIGIDKSRINRILEPFMWHTAIISSTEWDNFFALRCPPGNEPDINFPAQLEFQKVAILIRNAMYVSVPVPLDALGYPAWHMPLVSKEDRVRYPATFEGFWPMISAGRCARVSYDTHNKPESPDTSFARARRLMDSGHMSPFEHQARDLTLLEQMSFPEIQGNFKGFAQYRKTIVGEENMLARRPWEQEAGEALYAQTRESLGDRPV